MASYVVLTPPEADPEGRNTRFIHDGFAFWALILPVFWLLWHRLWLWALGAAVLTAGANWIMQQENGFCFGLALALAVSILSALEGQGARVAKWVSRGYRVNAVVDAPDLETAEAIYFANRPPPVDSRTDRPAPFLQQGSRPDDGQSFGMFEWNGGR